MGVTDHPKLASDVTLKTHVKVLSMPSYDNSLAGHILSCLLLFKAICLPQHYVTAT